MNERDRIQFYSALGCRSRGTERTPGKGETWAKWFEKRWGETLEQYAKRAKAEGIAERIIEHELEHYGRSPARELVEALKGERRRGNAGRAAKGGRGS